MNTIISTTPQYMEPQYTRVDFNRSEFNRLIFEKGYRVTIETAMTCPCKSFGGANLSSCLNCGGRGWLFFNKRSTRLGLMSMGLRYADKPWSEEIAGQVSITAMDSENLARMDRITVVDGEAIYTETRDGVSSIGGSVWFSTVYELKQVFVVFAFESTTSKLILIDSAYYSFTSNILTISAEGVTHYGLDPDAVTISIRYAHCPVFHVIDMTRDVLNSFQINQETNYKDLPLKMPTHAIGRRAEYVFEQMNAVRNDGSSTQLLDNSFAVSQSC